MAWFACCKKSPQVPDEKMPDEKLVFDRTKMLHEKGEWKIEGYWKQRNFSKTLNSKDAFVKSQYDEYKCHIPVKHPTLWPGKEEFVEKLQKLQKVVNMTGYDGQSYSRFEKDKTLGSREYADYEAMIMWPGDYLEHYIEKHNVLPSKEFYDYVMTVNIDNKKPKVFKDPFEIFEEFKKERAKEKDSRFG